jgi:hypothetical protein
MHACRQTQAGCAEPAELDYTHSESALMAASYDHQQEDDAGDLDRAGMTACFRRGRI